MFIHQEQFYYALDNVLDELFKEKADMCLIMLPVSVHKGWSAHAIEDKMIVVSLGLFYRVAKLCSHISFSYLLLLISLPL